MRCPRCGEELVTYALADSDDAAIVCESCGFADVPASHRSDATPPESWEDAIDRVETDDPVAEATRVANDTAISVAETEPTTIDGDRLDEGVSVAASLGTGSNAEADESQTDDSEADESGDDEPSETDDSETDDSANGEDAE